jgi:hypothetical protein
MSVGQLAARDLQRRLLGKTGQYVAPANFFVALSTTNPNEDGQGITEPTEPSYARASTDEADWTDPTLADPSVFNNSAIVDFGTAAEDWATGTDLAFFAIFRTLAGTVEADFLIGGALTVPKPVLTGDPATFPIGTLVHTMD